MNNDKQLDHHSSTTQQQHHRLQSNVYCDEELKMANKINRAYWSFSEKIEIPLKEEKPVTPILHYGLGRSGSLGPPKKYKYKYSNPHDVQREVNSFIAKNKIKKILSITDTCDFCEIADYGCDIRGEFPIKPCGGIELVWVEPSE